MRLGGSGLLPLLAAFAACGGPRAPESAKNQPTATLTLDSAALSVPRTAIPSASAEPLQVQPKNQGYPLPLTSEAVINLERDVLKRQILKAGSPELKRLLEHGITMLPTPGAERRFDVAYGNLRNSGLPILVSADSVLHQQHIVFNEILKAVEQQTMAPLLSALLAGLHKELAAELDRSPHSEPALNELALISVARKLLDPKFEPLPAIASRVSVDLAQIDKHEGLKLSYAQSSLGCLESQGEAGRCYFEDFSQYVPRGHYTVSEPLRRYFQSTMWLGRMGRRIKHDDELVQQVLLVQAAKRARCTVDGKELAATEVLGRLDQILEYFIGVSDDLTLSEVDGVVRAKLGPGSELAMSRETLDGLRASLRKLRAPRILSGAIEAYGANADETAKQETQGLRLLGQRFAPDSEMLGRLVFEHTGPNPKHARFAEVAADAARVNRNDICVELPAAERKKLPELSCQSGTAAQWRCICERSIKLSSSDKPRTLKEQSNTALDQVCRMMPSALDVGAAMGSALAERLTSPSREYCGYEKELGAVRETWRASEKEAPATLYRAWLGALTPLLQPVPRDYPTWMTGSEYERKALRTFLASWTELRHDTILYVKQSYTAMRRTLISGEITLRPPESYGLVEPQPELYRRLKLLSMQTRLFLRTLSALPESVDKALLAAEGSLERLTQISVHQLEGKGLTRDDEQYIKNIGHTLFGVAVELTKALEPPPEPPPDVDKARVVFSTETQNLDQVLTVPLVADVHTDLNTKRVLEQGTGPLEWMLAVSRLPDGSLSVAIGPVFSHREFVHPLEDRLPNEKWRGPLKAGQALPEPRWWTEGRPLANGFELPSLELLHALSITN